MEIKKLGSDKKSANFEPLRQSVVFLKLDPYRGCHKDGSAMVASVTDNPLIRVLDIRGVDYTGPKPPMPDPIGPSTGKVRSPEEMAAENGFNGLSDLRCRLAEVNFGSYMWFSAFLEWYYTDGSKGGLEGLIKSQQPPIGPQR